MEDSELSMDNDAYSMNIETLYVAVLSRIRELPHTEAVLKELEDVVAAPFNSTQPEVLEARQDLLGHFNVFWQASYVHMSEPEDGWPEKIDMCLKMVAGDYVVPEAPASEREVSPTISEMQFAAEATTPVVERQSTPPPPQCADEDVFTTPSVPSTPVKSGWLSTLLNPTTPGHSPSKRALFMPAFGADKENMSPLVHTPRSSVKRKIALDEGEAEKRADPETPTRGNKAARRARARRGSVSEDEDSVSMMLWAQDEKEESEQLPKLSIAEKESPLAKKETPKFSFTKESLKVSLVRKDSPKVSPVKKDALQVTLTGTKRKREVFDCVEISTKPPAWAARFDDATSFRGEKVGPPARKLRRVVSAPFQGRPVPPTSESKQEQEAELPSSDDDPHFGQVTPRHLISPALTKARSSLTNGTRSIRSQKKKLLFDLSNRHASEDEDEEGEEEQDPPSSDDTYAPPSPSKQAEERRFRRTSSGGVTIPMPLFSR